MHFCQGEMEQVTMNHLDNNSCKDEMPSSCCPPKKEAKHCELPKGETKKKDDCCKDISYSDKVVEKQVVKIQKIIPITFIVAEILHIQPPVIKSEVKDLAKYLDSYIESNAPPNYIQNSQLTFYEG